jgi:hypothetical protein
MRVLKYIAALGAILASGWLLLGYYGLSTTAKDRASGWQIYELPSHPVARMAIFLILGLTLPFLSAWLMKPSQAAKSAQGAPKVTPWGSYSLRLVISFVGAILCAFIIAFILMALLDSGAI